MPYLIYARDTLMPWSGFASGLFGIFAVRTYIDEQYLRSEILSYLAGTGLIGITLWWLLPERSASLGMEWAGCLLGGLVCVFIWYRFAPGLFDRAQAKLTKRSGVERLGRTDVRTVAKLLPQHHNEYDPRQYHRAGEFFMGLDQNNNPIYWAGNLPHIAIAGTSGCGKGRKLQDLAAQSIMNSEALFYLDPKDDEWGAHALYSACNEHGKPYHYLALLPENPAQINILAGAKAWEIEELFSATLSLQDTGKGADFFKAKDRNAAHHASVLAHEENLTIAELYSDMSNDVFWQKEAPGFLDKLREMAGVEAINARESSFSIAEIVANGGGVYVLGSMTLQAVKRAQQMIFVRIQQIATARDRMNGVQRTVCVIADEAKYHISRPVLQGLGASRDKGMRVVLSFQSFTDLKDCPADLNPEMVAGAIVENTPCKFIYKLEDPDSSDWFARKSGVILVDDETRQLEKNIALAEATNSERSIRQTEHFLFDSNKLSNLPTGWVVLFGKGLAQTCYVSPYRVDKCLAAITPIPAKINVANNKIMSLKNDVQLSKVTYTHGKIKRPKDHEFFRME
ncbi:MAG: TraM recognition domain-containing protein [Gallionella sp.]